MVTLRPYQQEAVEAIENEWRSGNDRTLLVLPTGAGKTIVFADIARRSVETGRKVLVLAHRGELLEQASDKIRGTTGLHSAIEKADRTAVGTNDSIVVGSVQTLQRDDRLEQFKKTEFGTIIVDEAHHAIADSYQHILNYFDTANVLGVTATSDRADMKDLGSYFKSLAYEYPLPQAIRDGYLSRIRALTVPLELDISKVSVQNGDFSAGETATALDPYLEQIADEMAKTCKDRKTVVFLPLIETSRKFCKLLQERGFRAAEVNGESKDRKEILQDFDDGRYNVLCNSMLLTEGWDCPSVDTIVVLRPTKSRSLYQQMVGRGTRLYPGKDHLLLIDFLWLTSRHDLCRPACLVCKSQDTAGAMTKRLEKGEELDIEEAVEQAEKDVLIEREEALAKELAAMRKRKRQFVDPLQYEMSISAEDLVNYTPVFAWEMAPASDKQLKALEKAGIYPEAVDNAGLAAKLLDRLAIRRQTGLATPKQIRCLERFGFRNVGEWKFESANKMIARLSRNSWRVPADVKPNEYKPKEEMYVFSFED